MLDYQFTCKHCGRTTFCNYEGVTKTYENRAITREECAYCGYICYNCRQLKDIRDEEIKDFSKVYDEVVNKDAEVE